MAAALSVLSLRRVAPLLLTLITVSAVVYFTSASFNGIYRTAVELMSSGEGVLLIYGADAKTPQTSIIPLSLYDRVTSVDGVETASPEVVAVALARDHAVIVRGVDPSSFQRICDLKIIQGVFDLNNSWSAIIGLNLAKLIEVSVGDRVLLRSAFTDSFLEVEIVGVFESGSSLDDELIVPIYTAQWLRGLSKNAISLLRVKVDLGKLSGEDLLAYLKGERKVEEKTSIEESPIIRLLTIPRAREYAKEYIVKSPEESMRDFLQKVTRVNETAIWGIVAVVISGSILLIHLSFSLMFLSHSRELTMLRRLGMSKRSLTTSMIVFAIILSTLAAITGFVLGNMLSETFSGSKLLLLGSYTSKPAISFDTVIITAVVLAIVSVISTWLELKRLYDEGL